jgi:hypothetical protein
MNLDSISSPLSSTAVRSAGQRLDVSVSELASPVSPTQSVPQSEIGSIKGVLTAQENHAIQALFTPRQGTYAAGGQARSSAVPGMNLDLKA